MRAGNFGRISDSTVAHSMSAVPLLGKKNSTANGTLVSFSPSVFSAHECLCAHLSEFTPNPTPNLERKKTDEKKTKEEPYTARV
jgi:hypothetical protein